MMFPTKGPGRREWTLTDEQAATWQGTYPAMDVMAECQKALAWIDASPDRRKTARGMPRFLVGWLNRASERPTPSMPGQQPMFRGWTCPHVEQCAHRGVCANKVTLGTAKYPLKKADV